MQKWRQGLLLSSSTFFFFLSLFPSVLFKVYPFWYSVCNALRWRIGRNQAVKSISPARVSCQRIIIGTSSEDERTIVRIGRIYICTIKVGWTMRTFKIREIRNLIPFFFCLPGQQRWYKWNIGISEIIPELTINFLPERKRKGSVLFLSLSLSSSLALALFLSVQQFDKATSVSASKGIKRDYWTVDWITAFSRGFPSFECKARRINFRVGRRFYGGTRTRNYRKEENSRGKRERRGKTCAVVEHRASFVHPFLSHGIST